MDPLQALEEHSPLIALFEHRARAEHIVRVIARYGLADAATLQSHTLLAQLAGRVAPDPALQGLSRGERLRDALLELGTTFIKVGQILSTRPDLVGPDIAATLSSLQADTPADTPEHIIATLAQEFDTSPEKALAKFGSFNPVPLASASVGQVCSATTQDGTEVVVKVRHAGVKSTVEEDLAIIGALATILESEVTALSPYQPTRVARELSHSLRNELDFRRELSNLIRVRANFDGTPGYVFPVPIPELSGSSVLTETRVEGTRLSAVLSDLGPHTDDVIHSIADMYFHMIFVDGLFHADPHPGNLLITDDGQLGVLDFGRCGRLRDALRESFVDFLASLFGDDLVEMTRCLLEVAPGPTTLDADLLQADLEAWVDQYFPKATGLPMHLNLGAAVTSLLELVRRYALRLPADISLMLIVVVQLQGLVEESGSSLTLTQLLRPYASQLEAERLSPKRFLRTLTRGAHRWERLLDVVPGDLTRMFEAGSRGKLQVPLKVQGIDRPVNRLAYALMASAAINGASHMLSRRAQPSVGRWSVPGMVGAAAAGYLTIEVVRSARRSGGLAS